MQNYDLIKALSQQKAGAEVEIIVDANVVKDEPYETNGLGEPVSYSRIIDDITINAEDGHIEIRC